MKWLLILFAFAGSLLAAEYHPSLPAIGSLDGLGVNIHFTDPQPGELEMIKAAGFKWVRMDLTWAATERERGTYDFGAFDRLVAALEKNGLRAVFILDYANKLYDEGLAPHTDEGRAAFAKWAAAAVARYARKGFLWELWNEPNIAQFWKPKPAVQQYIALAKIVCPAIRAVAPKEALIGPATSKIDLAFLEECFKAGLLEHWCAVSVHPYRQTAPETVEEEYRSVRLLIRKYAPKDKAIPVVSGEWGYSTAWKNYDEEKQAKYLARMFLTNIANDVPLSIWYDWRDDGDDPKEGEHRFGIVRREFHKDAREPFEPKPAYMAARKLASELAGITLNKRFRGAEPHSLDLLFAGPAGLSRVMLEEGSGEILYQKPEDDAQRRYLKAAVDWSVAPSELFVNVPSKLSIRDELVNSGTQSLAIDLWTELVGVEKPMLICGLPLEEPKAKWLLSTGQRAIEKGSFGVELARRGQYLIHGFRVVESGSVSAEFRQTTELIISNALEINMVAPRPDGFLFHVANPSGQVFKGTAGVTVVVSNGTGGRDHLVGSVAVKWPANQTETFIFVPWPRPTTAQESAFFRYYGLTAWRSWSQLGVSLYNQSDRRQRSYSRWCYRPHVLDGLATGLLEAREQGEAAKERTPFPLSPASTSPSRWPGHRLSHSFAGGSAFLTVRPVDDALLPIEMPWLMGPMAPYNFAIWLHGDGNGCQARIRFIDATGQTFQPDGPRIDWKGWRYVSFPMRSTPENPLAHWGGANDRVIHYPIKWDSIFLLDNISRDPLEGEIYLSAPTLHY